MKLKPSRCHAVSFAGVAGPGQRRKGPDVYDVGGNLLIQRDPGHTTLYLPASNSSWTPPPGTVTGTRYYRIGGAAIAARTLTTVSYLIIPRQGRPRQLHPARPQPRLLHRRLLGWQPGQPAPLSASPTPGN
jgi:hypothetical protein